VNIQCNATVGIVTTVSSVKVRNARSGEFLPIAQNS